MHYGKHPNFKNHLSKGLHVHEQKLRTKSLMPSLSLEYYHLLEDKSYQENRTFHTSCKRSASARDTRAGPELHCM
jgi:hypothetical protein